MSLSTQVELTQALTFSGSTALHAMGTIYFDYENAKAYRYSKVAAAVTNDVIAITESVCADSGGVFYVNNDFAEGTGLGVATPMGVAISQISEGYYGWMQVGGVATVITDGSVAAGEALVLDSSNDGDVDTMADGEEEQVFGFATADDADTVGTMLLKGLI